MPYINDEYLCSLVVTTAPLRVCVRDFIFASIESLNVQYIQFMVIVPGQDSSKVNVTVGFQLNCASQLANNTVQHYCIIC